MDFFNTAFWSGQYEAFTEWKSVYPPILLAILRILLKFIHGSFSIASPEDLRTKLLIIPSLGLTTYFLTLIYTCSQIRASILPPLRLVISSFSASLFFFPSIIFLFERLNTFIIIICILTFAVGYLMIDESIALPRLGVLFIPTHNFRYPFSLSSSSTSRLIILSSLLFLCCLIKPYFWISLCLFNLLTRKLKSAITHLCFLLFLFCSLNSLPFALGLYNGDFPSTWLHNLSSFSSDSHFLFYSSAHSLSPQWVSLATLSLQKHVSLIESYPTNAILLIGSILQVAFLVISISMIIIYIHMCINTAIDDTTQAIRAAFQVSLLPIIIFTLFSPIWGSYVYSLIIPFILAGVKDKLVGVTNISLKSLFIRGTSLPLFLSFSFLCMFGLSSVSLSSLSYTFTLRILAFASYVSIMLSFYLPLNLMRKELSCFSDF